MFANVLETTTNLLSAIYGDSSDPIYFDFMIDYFIHTHQKVTTNFDPSATYWSRRIDSTGRECSQGMSVHRTGALTVAVRLDFMGVTGGARLPEGAAPGGTHAAVRAPG